MGKGAVSATFRYCVLHFGKGIFGSLIIEKTVNGGTTVEDIYLRIRIAEKESPRVQCLGIKKRIAIMYPLGQPGIFLGVGNRLDGKEYMVSGPAGFVALLLVVVAAGCDNAGNALDHLLEIFDGNPVGRIVRVVIIVVQYHHRRFQKVIDAAIIVLKTDQGMIIPEQLPQFFRSTAGSLIGIGAVPGIAAAVGMVNRQRKGTAVCFIFHSFHLFAPKKGHKKSTAA